MLHFGKRLRGGQVRRLDHSRTNRENYTEKKLAWQKLQGNILNQLGKGLSCHEQGRKEDPTEESRQLGQTKEPFPELQAPISLEEVKEAIKGMKEGRGRE